MAAAARTVDMVTKSQKNGQNGHQPLVLVAHGALIKETSRAKKSWLYLLLTPRFLRWLVGTAGAWFLLDIAYYGTTISSPLVLKSLNPHANLVTNMVYTLIIFVVAAFPGYVVSVFTIDRLGRKWIQCFGAGVLYGLLTGVCIATYTLVDKQAVSVLLIAPVLLYYSDLMIHVGLLAPYAVYNWSEVSREWNMHRFEVIGIAILGPLSYFIILSVLVFTPVSYVAPMREVSVLIGTLMGTRFLAEGNTHRRLLAACVMVAGIIALAV